MAQLHEGPAIRLLVPDLRRLCFSFSPDYLAAVARRRGGRAGVFLLETYAGRAFLPVLLFKRRFLALATILAPPCDDQGNTLDVEVESNVLEVLTATLKQSGLAHRLTQPTNWSLFQAAPRGAAVVPFGSYVLPLGVETDALWSGLHQKHRNVIRAATRAGVRVAVGKDEIDACFSLYRATMLRNGMSHEPRDLLEGMTRSEDFDVFCGVAYVEDRPVAALFAPYNAHGAYYLFGGTSDDMGVNGANNLLHFEAIRTFASHGAAFYDFVGARLGTIENQRLRGIQRFKSRFGAELRQGVLWKQDLSPIPCIAHDVLLHLRNTVAGIPPSSDIIDQEMVR